MKSSSTKVPLITKHISSSSAASSSSSTPSTSRVSASVVKSNSKGVKPMVSSSTRTTSTTSPLKKSSSVTTNVASSSTNSSTSISPTRRHISPTKRTLSTNSVSNKLGAGVKKSIEKKPVVKSAPPVLTSEWIHSLLMDINLDHSIPLTSSKHPNHQFIKNKDESIIKEMEKGLFYSIGDGERRLAPCDKSGIQLDGQYTTGHNVHFSFQPEKFSFFSWTLILRVYVEEKSSCIFSFGPWYRWFVLSTSSVQLNQGNTFAAKYSGLKTNQWNDILISFNFDQEVVSFDQCKEPKVIKGKKEILVICNGVENIFGLPSGSELRGPEDSYGMKNEKGFGFLNMSCGASLRGTVSSVILFSKSCNSTSELKDVSSLIMNLHTKPNGMPILLDQVPMPKILPKHCIRISGTDHFKSTISKYPLVVILFSSFNSMYRNRQYVFPFINYFVDYFTKAGDNGPIKCANIDTENGNYDLKKSLQFISESFIFFKNGKEIARVLVDDTKKLDSLKQEIAEFEKLISEVSIPESYNDDEPEVKSNTKEKTTAASKPISTTPIQLPKTSSQTLEKPIEWLESVMVDININYEIRIANPTHPNNSLYSKNNVLSSLVEQCRYSIDKNVYKEMAICDQWGIQFDGDFASGDVNIDLKSVFFTKSAWSLFMRVYVASSSENIFACGPKYRWFTLSPSSLGLSNHQNHYSISGIKRDDWNDIFVSFNVDLPKSPKDICKVNNVIKNKMELLLIINDKKSSIPLDGFKFSDRLEPFEDNSIGFMNMASATCLRGVVSSMVVLNKPCKNLDELENVGSFFLQNHIKYMNDPIIVDYKTVLGDNPKKSNNSDHGKTIVLSKENQYDQIIAKYPIVIVDFFAVWCGPCMHLAPSLAQLSLDYPAVKIVKVDVDQFPNIARIANVRAMPTIVYFFKQKEVKRQEGGSKGSIDANINGLLSKLSPKEKESITSKGSVK